MLHSIRTNQQIGAWHGDIPCTNTYTAGLAGERFLRALQDEGAIHAVRCDDCDLAWLPPRIFCSECLARLEDEAWTELALDEARLEAHATCRENLHGAPLSPPRHVGRVSWPEVTGGLLVDVRVDDPSDLAIGATGRVVLRPEEEREGSIADIEAFVID